MSEMPAKYDVEPAVVEQLIRGDVSSVPREALLRYIFTFCERVGISPLAVPFSLLKTQRGMQLVANRNFYDAVASKYAMSRECVGEGFFEGTKLYFTRYRARTPDGRITEDMALVDTTGLSGNDLANAIMKAHTKGRNRVTRAHLGFPFPDETEAETVPNASVVSIEELPNGNGESPASEPEIPKASEQQIKRIHVLAKKLGMNEEAYRRLLSERFGCKSSKSLSAEQANALIQELTQLCEREQAQEAQPQPQPEPQAQTLELPDEQGPKPNANSDTLVSPVDANEHLQQLGISQEDVRAWRKAWVDAWGDGMAFNRIAISATSREDFIRAMQQCGVRISAAVGGM